MLCRMMAIGLQRGETNIRTRWKENTVVIDESPSGTMKDVLQDTNTTAI